MPLRKAKAVSPQQSLQTDVTDLSAAVLQAAIANQDMGPAAITVADMPTTLAADPPAPSTPDLAASRDSGWTPDDNVTSWTSLVFTGKSVSGATIAVYDGVTLLGTTVAGTMGTWSFTSSGFKEGQHDIATIVTDATGQSSGRSTVLSVTVDVTPPAAPGKPKLDAKSDWGASSSDSITSSSAFFVINGKATANTRVRLVDESLAGGLGSWETMADASGNWSLQLSLYGYHPSAGIHSFTATAIDRAGNWSIASQPLRVTVEPLNVRWPPEPVLDAASDTGFSQTDRITRAQSLVLNGAGAPIGAVIHVGLTGISDWQYVGWTRADAGGNWSIQTKALADGQYMVDVDTWPTFSGTVAWGTNLITVDTIAPLAPTLGLTAASDDGASSSDNITSHTTPVFTGVAEAGSWVTLSSDGAEIGRTQAAPGGNWTLAVTDPMVLGSHDIMAQATDAAGNAGAATHLTLRILARPATPGTPDLVARSDTGLSDSDNITRSRTMTLTGGASAGATVAIDDGAIRLGTTIAKANGTWSFRTTALSDGTHSFTTHTIGTAGIESDRSSALSVTVDGTTPATPARPALARGCDTGRSNIDGVTNDNTPTLTGMTEAGARVAVTLDDVVVATVQADATGAWCYTKDTPLADGAHNAKVQATDAAGNNSATSGYLRFTVDTASPVAPVITSLSPTQISGTAEAGTTVTLVDGAALLGSAITAASGAWSVNGTFAARDLTTLVANASDAAGNAAASAPVHAVIGTSGADMLAQTGAGPVILVGGGGDDSYALDGSGDEQVVEIAGQGSDTIFASTDCTLAAGASIQFLTATGTAPLVLTGNELRNTIHGGDGDDTIDGGGGADVLYGGAGADRFVLSRPADSNYASCGHDMVEDFSQAQHDILDLSRLDADLGTPGDQGFTLIGTAAFHGVAGELRVLRFGGVTAVYGDTDGDAVANIAIGLRGTIVLAAADFRL